MKNNNMKAVFLLSFIYFAFFCMSYSIVSAQEPALEAELLIFEEIPVVITASKYEQPITEAPATISVITEEDIKYSGARDIQEVLRRVPGIEVMVSKSSQIDVGVRGDVDTLYKRLLVLVDGRSVYQDFYGMTEWEHLEIGLDEIKRIEVIRGPGSALYGANAFAGVVNIITKSPEEMKGTLIRVGGGNFHSRYGDIYHGNVKDNLGYKLSLGWKDMNRWGNTHEDSLDIGRFNSVVEYELDEDSKLSFSGGISSGESELVIGGAGGGSYDSDAEISYLKTEYKKSDLYIRAFWNRTNFDAYRQGASQTRINGLSNIYDIELQHSFYLNLWKAHRITWGTSYRLNTINSEQIDTDHQWNLFAGYIHDELKLNDKLLLNLGARIDYHPLTYEHISPRGSIIFMPKEGHLIRFWAGTSFKTPSYAELYSNTRQGILTVRGNEELESEEIIAYDLGYEFPLFNKRAKGMINIFYNHMEQIIENQIILITSSYYNRGERNTTGCEAGIDFLITDNLKGFANYTFQEVENELTGGKWRAAPKNKFNTGLRLILDNGFSADLSIHYVDDYEVTLGKVDSYVLANCRLAYMFPNKDLELALAIYNLLHDKHLEYASVGDVIGTFFTLDVKYKF